MALLFLCDGEDADVWSAALRAEIDDLDIRVWPDGVGDPHDIDVALTWQPPRGVLASFPNLKAILSLGAGVEHILRDPELPPGVPVVHLIDPGLKSGMVEFVTMEVWLITAAYPNTEHNEAAGEWRLLRQTLSRDRRVGILGMGHLGTACGEVLGRFGFPPLQAGRGPEKISPVSRASAAKMAYLSCLSAPMYWFVCCR